MSRSAQTIESRGVLCILRMVVACLVAGLLSACGGAETAPPIAADELLERIRHGNAPYILDVRSTGEFDTMHIAGARNIPHYLLEERIGELPEPGSEIVLVDQKGGRSRQALVVLTEAGFTQVRTLKGQMFQWVMNRYPVGD